MCVLQCVILNMVFFTESMERKKSLIVDGSVIEEEERNTSPFLYVGVRAFFFPHSTHLFLERKKKIKEVILHVTSNKSMELYVKSSHGRSLKK